MGRTAEMKGTGAVDKKLTRIADKAKQRCAEVTDLGDILEVADYDLPTDFWHLTWYRVVRRRVASASVSYVDLTTPPCPPLLLDNLRDIVRAEFSKLLKTSM